MILMLAPAPNMTFGAMPSGASYTSDQYALVKVTNNSAADQTALQEAGCYTLTPFGGWGNAVFETLAELYAADASSGLILPGQTGFPQYMAATITDDSGNTGTWAKTGTGSGSGNWTQVSTETFYTAATSASDAEASRKRAQNAVPFMLWTDLAAATGMAGGDRASVSVDDTGTHTDPVVGGTVDNAGLYEYSESPAGWERTGDTDGQTAETAAASVSAQAAQLTAEPVVNLWPWNGMALDYGSGQAYVYTGTTSLPTATRTNYYRDFVQYGQNFPVLRLKSTASGNIIRWIEVPQSIAALVADGDTCTLEAFMSTDRSGSSGTVCKLVWVASDLSSSLAASSSAYVGATGKWLKAQTSGGVSTSVVAPSSAGRRLFILVYMNASASGQVFEFYVDSISRGTRGNPSRNNRSAAALAQTYATVELTQTETIYVQSPNGGGIGSDTNSGDQLAPLATIEAAVARAMANSKRPRIFLQRGGDNIIPSATGFPTTVAQPTLEIVSQAGVIIDFGTKLTSFTKTAGYNYIYEVASFSPDTTDISLNYIWENGYTKSALAVPSVNKNPLYGNDTVRLPKYPIKKTASSVKATALAAMDAGTLGEPEFFYSSSESKLYFVAHDQGDPTGRTIVSPRQRWFGDGTSTRKTGKIIMRGVTLYHGGIYDNGQDFELHNVTCMMTMGDGIYPTVGNWECFNLRVGGAGNDGSSPHGSTSVPHSLQLTVIGFLFHDCWDEGCSDHYIGCKATYIRGDSEYNGSSGYAPAYGAHTEFHFCRSRENQQLQTTTAGPGVSDGDAGFTLLNNSGYAAYPTTARAFNCASTDDGVGFKTKPGAGSTCNFYGENLKVIDPTVAAYYLQGANDTVIDPTWRDGATASDGAGAITNKIASTAA